MAKNRKKKTASRTSPKGGNKGCLCEDGTYSRECCDGSLQAQGIGATENGQSSNVTNVYTTRTVGGSR